ncbi:MAG: ribosome silencing factor [Oscillospiraceae bacterium]
MESIDLAKEIVKILDSKKADNVEAIKVKDLPRVTDYFVIAAATNTTHVKSLVDEVEFKLKEKFSLYPKSVDGYGGSNWIALDYLDVVVHIFYEPTRNEYNLEKLWSDGESVDISRWIEE